MTEEFPAWHAMHGHAVHRSFTHHFLPLSGTATLELSCDRAEEQTWSMRVVLCRLSERLSQADERSSVQPSCLTQSCSDPVNSSKVTLGVVLDDSLLTLSNVCRISKVNSGGVLMILWSHTLSTLKSALSLLLLSSRFCIDTPAPRQEILRESHPRSVRTGTGNFTNTGNSKREERRERWREEREREKRGRERRVKEREREREREKSERERREKERGERVKEERERERERERRGKKRERGRRERREERERERERRVKERERGRVKEEREEREREEEERRVKRERRERRKSEREEREENEREERESCERKRERERRKRERRGEKRDEEEKKRRREMKRERRVKGERREKKRKEGVTQREDMLSRVKVLKLELKQIREQQDLLFRFMNFLKQEGAVHVLQFCLTVEEFNDRILQPELSDSQLFSLHSEVQTMYQTYCLDESMIRSASTRSSSIRSITLPWRPTLMFVCLFAVAVAPYTEVVRLQKTTCLFEAYEHVLSLLENVFTPMFCHSDEYFRHLLRGVESPSRGSRISSVFVRLRPCAAPSADEEALYMFPPSSVSIKSWSVVTKCDVCGGGDDGPGGGLPVRASVLARSRSWSGSGPGLGSSSGSGRNLSEWNAWIPFIDVMEDEIRKERVPAFLIQVQRDDRRGVGHESESWCVLRRYMEFYVLESKLTEFHGAFADAQLPSKRILGPKNYEFLESKRPEFEEYLQKGQNLEPFIQSFFNSCESPKPKPSRNELTVLSPTANMDKKLYSPLYKNNLCDLPDRKCELSDRKCPQNYFLQQQQLHGMFDYMMFVDAVFREESQQHRTEADKQTRAKRTFEEMLQYLPDFVSKLLGDESKYEGVRLLFDTIQQPLLNKQMSYVLLDIAVQELFPELSKVSLCLWVTGLLDFCKFVFTLNPSVQTLVWTV
ncbi:hypothetical protein WMY93_015234 [Mugilogobius chulae]|uniref:PX domain-containing protein n=1 Tax=Mugilogobius chulae TaxID=88201 RepID=A0AAW0NS86_9GOBI